MRRSLAAALLCLVLSPGCGVEPRGGGGGWIPPEPDAGDTLVVIRRLPPPYVGDAGEPPCGAALEFPCPDGGAGSPADMDPPGGGDADPPLARPGEPCADHGDCSTWCDCRSGTCHTGEVPPSCSDGRVNGDETDVDCGGPDCAPCERDQWCAGGLGNVYWHCHCRSGFCAQTGSKNVCR